MGDTLEEKIQDHAPGNATGYYLLTQRNGHTARYPPYGAFSLKPFSPPSGAPFGSYMLHFVRRDGDGEALAPVQAPEGFVRIQLVPPGRQVHAPVLDNIARRQAACAEVLPMLMGTDETASDPAHRSSDNELDAFRGAMMTVTADVERQRMAMELAENNQELLRKGRAGRDAAEALALNRAYRRESQAAIESQTHWVRQTADDVTSHWAALRLAQETQFQNMRLIKEQLEMFSRPPPPPPAPDYGPVLVEGIKTLRDFGVALVQAKVAGASLLGRAGTSEAREPNAALPAQGKESGGASLGDGMRS